LSIATSESAKGKATKDDIGQLQQRAAEAAERGNMDELQRIAQEMLKAVPRRNPPPRRRTEGANWAAAQPIPLNSQSRSPAKRLERARRLGLAQAQAKVQQPKLRQLAQETFDRYGWHPSFPASETARDGEMHLRPLLEQEKISQDAVEPLLEAFSMFLLNPFVNSGGVRYSRCSRTVSSCLSKTFPRTQCRQSLPNCLWPSVSPAATDCRGSKSR
jgi:hypothetical protein